MHNSTLVVGEFLGKRITGVGQAEQETLGIIHNFASFSQWRLYIACYQYFLNRTDQGMAVKPPNTKPFAETRIKVSP